MPVTVKIYKTAAGMRLAAHRYLPKPSVWTYDDEKADGFTQMRDETKGPTIRLSRDRLSMRTIAHECTHAALALRLSHRVTWDMGESATHIGWLDELYCHIYDDLYCAVLAWILEDVTPGEGIPIDVDMTETNA